MTWKRWTVVGTAVVGFMGSVELATGSLTKVYGGIKEIGSLASMNYVNGELDKLAIDLGTKFDSMSKQQNVIGGILADQAVRQLEIEVKTLTREIVEKDAMIRALPDNTALKAERVDKQQELDQATRDLSAARCARVKASGHDAPCQSRF